MIIDHTKIIHALQRLTWLWLLLLWGGAVLALPLVHFGPVPLDEAAARGLLLNWSIYHQVASPIVLLGLPDLRALFFIPLTLYWPGSLVAPRVLWIIIAFFAAFMLYRWARRALGSEQALLAAGLLLVAPLTLTQIDRLGGGVFLLFCFLIAYWMERRYEAVSRPLGGWFYTRFLWMAVTVSVHPAGLAYPLALLWQWARDPEKPARLKKQNLVGVIVALALLALLQAGWRALPWFHNPADALTAVFHSTDLDPFPPPWEGGLLLALALVVAALQWKRLAADLFTRTLSLSLLLGMSAANADWAFLVMAFVLLFAFDGLIRLHDQVPGQGLLAKRGGVLLLLVVLAIVFLRDDRAYAQIVRTGTPTPHALLLQEVAVEVEALGKFARILSQWPGQTMVVCKCDVLSLPPGTEDPEQFLGWVEKARATHLVFDPRDPDNALVARDVAQLTDAMKTLFVNEAGVIVGVNKALEEAAAKAEKARAEEALPAEAMEPPPGDGGP